MSKEIVRSIILSNDYSISFGHIGSLTGTPESVNSWSAKKEQIDQKADEGGRTIEVYASAPDCQNWLVYVSDPGCR